MAKFITETIDINDKEYTVLIGRNDWGNDHIIKISNNNDIWMHLESDSSPHLILQNNGDTIEKKDLVVVARSLLKYKNLNNVSNRNIIYTNLENIKRTRVPGSVVTKHTKLLKM
jgi:predicted ribosome quality control (RQC) complex YloA/Tae2 family protein